MIVGSRDTVIEQLTELTDAGPGSCSVRASIGSMPHELVLEGMERLAAEVFPAFRSG